MKQLLEQLNKHIQTKGNDIFTHLDVCHLITGTWSCVVKPVEYRTRNIIALDNRLFVRCIRDQIELLFDGRSLYKSEVLNKETQKLTISFALSENLIRIQGCKNVDGTYKLAEDIKDFKPSSVSFHSSHILSLGEPEVFPKEEALKNMSGLEFWLIPDKNCMVYSGSTKVANITDISHNKLLFAQSEPVKSPFIDETDRSLFLTPSQSLEYVGSNCYSFFKSPNDFILFLALEPYEFSSTIQNQSLFKMEMGKNYIEFILSYSEEEITNNKEQEFVRQLYITQKVKIDELIYETVNFVDMFYKNWLIKNERPGPTIYFLSTQSVKENKATIQNYNYHDKWFIFEKLEYKINDTITEQEPIKITIGGNYHGKIKEIFLFNRRLIADEAFDDQSVKWIMAYLKQKYAITDTLIKLK